MAVIKKKKKGYKPKNINVIKLERFLKEKDGKHDKLG